MEIFLNFFILLCLCLYSFKTIVFPKCCTEQTHTFTLDTNVRVAFVTVSRDAVCCFYTLKILQKRR